jgi:hypothetical protein
MTIISIQTAKTSGATFHQSKDIYLRNLVARKHLMKMGVPRMLTMVTYAKWGIKLVCF